MRGEEVARRAVIVYALRREVYAIGCDAVESRSGETCLRLEKAGPCRSCRAKASVRKRLARASRRLRSAIRAYVRGLSPGGSDAVLEVALRGFAAAEPGARVVAPQEEQSGTGSTV